MNIQEQEERDFRPMSEEHNCFAEAQAHCASLSVQIATGSYVVNVYAPYYCRATDAYVGEFLWNSKGFEDPMAAERFAKQYDMDCENGDLRVKIITN